MSASKNELGTLHAAVATALTTAVTPIETEDGVAPPSAAHLMAAITFLKNNNITADAQTNKELQDLSKALAARRKKVKPDIAALAEAGEDLARQLGVGTDVLQ